MLQQYPRANVHVFVIWEPVLATDWGRPSPALTSLIADPRATHFWDWSRRLSSLYGGSGNLDRLAAQRNVSFRMRSIVWDTALYYPAGTRWGEPAEFLWAPVVRYRDQLSGAFARLVPISHVQ